MSEDLETKKKENAEMQSKLAGNNRKLQQLRDQLKDEYLTKQTISIELETEKKTNAELQSKMSDNNRELEQLKARLKEEKKIRTDLDMTQARCPVNWNLELQSKFAEVIFEVNQLRDQLKAEHRIQTELRDKETQIKKEKLLNAVLLVQRLRRAKLIVRKLKKEKANKTSQRTEADAMFEEIKVDDKMCGICGVFFNDKVETNLELEKSVFVGVSSLLNLNQAKSLVWESQPFQKQMSKEAMRNLSPTSQPLQKQVSGEGKRNPWGTTQENTLDKPELRKYLLQKFRSEHIQEPRHIQKALDFQSFKNKYRQYIAPKLRDINSFLYNPVFNLVDYNNVDKKFGREYMAIDRMFRKSKLVEKEIQLLLKSRMWSVTAGLVEQKVMELEDDFRTVKPYVEEVHLKLKQEEEEKAKQASASASAMSTHAENCNDEFEEIEPVVEEPLPERTQLYRRRRYRRRVKHFH